MPAIVAPAAQHANAQARAHAPPRPAPPPPSSPLPRSSLMPALFQMPFLARLTESAHTTSAGSSSTGNSNNNSSNNNNNNSNPIDTASPPVQRTVASSTHSVSSPGAATPAKRVYDHDDDNSTAEHDSNNNNTSSQPSSSKRPRLAAQILSSRPKLFANGLLSPVQTLASLAASTSGPLLPAAPPTGPRGQRASPPPLAPAPAHAKKTLGAANGKIASVPGTTTAAAAARGPGRRKKKSSGDKIQDAAAATRPGSRDGIKRYFRNEVRATPDIDAVSTPPHLDGETSTDVEAGEKTRSERRTARKLEDKRSLRSHDGGSRSRSELAQYFPNWDEIISNDPQPEEPLTYKTCLRITEDPPKAPSTPSKRRQIILPATTPTQKTPSKLGAGEARVLSPSKPANSATLNIFTHIDFSAHLASIPKLPARDPLSVEHFRIAHQRGERSEKQLKNIEKEKAQHEKVQLERLYDGLLGHDWLRVMGISGITDTEKRGWEQKRDWVLREVKVLLDKFERYKEEEKRLRMEKESNMYDEDESEEETDEEMEEVGDSEEDETLETDEHQQHRKRRRRSNPPTSKRQHKDHATVQDTNALAAQQLQTESLSSVAKVVPARGRKLTGIDVTPLLPIVPPAEEKPFVSFFDKPHLRAAALAGLRRGRSRFAFGYAVPEPEEVDFVLPRDMTTADARKASARMRRLRRRTKE